MPVGMMMPSKVAFVRVTRDLPANFLYTLGTTPPCFVVFGSLFQLIYLVYYHCRCEFLVMMVQVVVPVAINRLTLDKPVAKEHILSYICAAFLATHMRVAAARTLCFAQLFPRTIFPTTISILFHRLALVNAPWGSLLLIVQQRIIIRRRLLPRHHRLHRHHTLSV